MANLGFRQSSVFSDHGMPCLASATINIGAAGAPTLAAKSKILSVSRVSTGLYRAVLAGPFASIYSMDARACSPPAGVSLVVTFELANDQATTVASLSAPHFDFKCLDAAGAVVDPASGSALKIQLMLNNSSLAG